MLASLRKIRLLACCCFLSIAVHLLTVYAMRLLGHYEFGAAVAAPPAVMVDLAQVKEVAAPAAAVEKPAEAKKAAAQSPAPPPKSQLAVAPTAPSAPSAEEERPEDDAPASAARELPEPQPAKSPLVAKKEEPLPPGKDKVDAPAQRTAQAAAAKPAAGALRSLASALASRQEKLSYQISMHGLPIGSAELEAKSDKGVTSITLRTRSNPALSSFYPVDNLVESQLVDGMYILSKVRQREGSYSADETFTINLRTRKVFWFDLNHSKPVAATLPSDDVLDTLSGIYYLRNRQLQVGRTETLHIFDSETYAEVPVEVLRREEIRLPNLTKVATLVVRPLQKTAGIFRRTGELLIWLTDDERKVPVRIETSVPLGRVTAELVAAENKPQAAATALNTGAGAARH